MATNFVVAHGCCWTQGLMAHQGGLTMGFSSHLVLFIDVKNAFLRFFYFGHIFYVIFLTFLFKKRWQSSERQAD